MALTHFICPKCGHRVNKISKFWTFLIKNCLFAKAAVVNLRQVSELNLY